ncbi:ABC transporter substrate-binding protein [Suttonella ornithocola]|uniref:ABC-type uncharacterized transport system, periplasmic component n=1 Tax=Suttonella ornithocola TaxID=279832 RepID=A0A380MV71_9GAMM|nr:ABC transporter substrate-binding protein [Suttonella ornithocola]SUO96490.1 ABC-type uncharacterized transport system, periplasmic component [Suttonella ornithocola]
MKLFKPLLALTIAASSITAWSAEQPVVAVAQIISHPALDASYQGLVEELENAGYKNGENIKILREIAQGDQSLAMQIAQKFVGENPTVLVGISTPSAQTLKAASHGKIPVVFSAVTDPVAADLVKDKAHPGGMVTGASDRIPLEKGVEMLKQILPNAKTIGTVYNPGEANSETAVKELDEVLKNQDMKLVKAPATKTAEVLDAARSLVGKVDTIYITLDNIAVGALASIIQVGEQSKIPVFTVDTSSVANGAIAALGFSYEDVGRESGKQVVAILKGQKPENLPVKEIEALELYLNPGAAQKMGVELPQAIVDNATHIVETKK